VNDWEVCQETVDSEKFLRCLAYPKQRAAHFPLADVMLAFG